MRCLPWTLVLAACRIPSPEDKNPDVATSVEAARPGASATAAADVPTAPRVVIDLPAPASTAAKRPITLDIHRTAPWLEVVWTVDDAHDLGAPVARLTWTYADGSTAESTIFVGDEITTEHMGGTVAMGLVVAGPQGIRTRAWVANPRPDVEVASVKINAIDKAQLTVDSAATTGKPDIAIPLERWNPTGGWNPGNAGWSPKAPRRVSALEQSATGTHGFVGIHDGHLSFDDGTRARFWGVNLARKSALPSKDEVDAYVDGLVAAGVNMVRLHRVDGNDTGLLDPNRKPGQPPFDTDKLDRFDRLVAACEQRGIYVFLEVATNRDLGPGDGVEDVDGLRDGFKLVTMWDPTWKAAYLQWTRDWIGRTNPHTGKAYKDDPGVALVELSNEHSLVLSWLGGQIEQVPPALLAGLDHQWNDYLKAKYKTKAALQTAWASDDATGLAAGEDLGTVQRRPFDRPDLKRHSRQRARDLLAFYRGLEEKFYADVAHTVRDDLGFHVPIVGSIASEVGVEAEIQSALDLGDIHFEWDQAKGNDLQNVSLLTSDGALARFGRALADKPTMISEINHPFPNEYRAEGPLFWASMASVQDWDVVLWFNWANQAYDPARTEVTTFDIATDATKWAQFATAAAVFRSGIITPAPGSWTTWRSPAWTENEMLSGADPDAPQLQDVAFALGHKLRQSIGPTPPSSGPIEGQPGAQVGWWQDSGHLVVDTSWLDAVVGPARAIGTVGAGPRATARLDTDLDDFAAVSLMALDGTLGDGPALLTAVGRAQGEGTLRTPNGHFVEVSGGDVGLRMAPLTGTIHLTWPHEPRVTPLGVDGVEGAPLKAQKSGDGWDVHLDGSARGFWWRVD